MEGEQKNQQKIQIQKISKPIIYGNVTFWLGKKADQTASHKWACYVRGVYKEDLSYFIKKVQFTLHPSFPNPIRTVTQHPFEIHAQGWGIFDIGIKIFFVQDYEKPIQLYHKLQLHPSEKNALISVKKPVISEFYDEIVFVNPSKEFIQILNIPPKIPFENQNLSLKRNQHSQLNQSYDEDQDHNNTMNIEQHQSSDNIDVNEINEDSQIQLSDYAQYLINFDESANSQKSQLEDAIAYINQEIIGLQDKINKQDEIISKINKDYNQLEQQNVKKDFNQMGQIQQQQYMQMEQ